MNHTTTVSTKGQVILPKSIRDELQWPPGTRLTVEHTSGGVLLTRQVSVFPPTRPEDVFGSVHYAGPPKTLEQMEAGIAEEARRRHARGRY